jgi:hypothetical protein
VVPQSHRRLEKQNSTRLTRETSSANSISRTTWCTIQTDNHNHGGED